MKLYINYNNNKSTIDIHKYSSITCLLSKSINNEIFIDENKDINQYNAIYNGKLLHNDLSLDYYGITDGDVININKKLIGGKTNLWELIKKHPFLSLIIIIIILLPMFMLPVGYLPAMSSLIKIIVDRSFSSVSQFLVCNYGKSTLVSRFYFIISIFKFIFFILIIYVTITLPITILFIFLKGHKITDDPVAMCEPLKNGANVGGILTFLYFFFYILYRGLNKVFNFFIAISDKYYVTSSAISPSLKSIRDWYNRVKYLPGIITPNYTAEFLYLDRGGDMLSAFLNTVVQIGCKFDNKTRIGSILNKNIETISKDVAKDANADGENHLHFNINFPECSGKSADNLECCSTDNFLKMANILFKILTGEGGASGSEKGIEKSLEEKSLKSAAVLMTEGLYEKVLENNDLDDQKRTSVEENIKILTDVMKSIADEKGYDYNKSKYSLTNKIFKSFYITAFCNVVTTAHSAQEVIKEMGFMNEIIDMYKSGMVCGNIIAKIYFLAIIAIIIMSIFGFF